MEKPKGKVAQMSSIPESKTSGVVGVDLAAEEQTTVRVEELQAYARVISPVERVAVLLALVSDPKAEGVSMVNVKALVDEVMPKDSEEAAEFVRHVVRLRDATASLATYAQETMWARQRD